MNDALQWVLTLMAGDLALVVSGILALTLLIEILCRFREWIS